METDMLVLEEVFKNKKVLQYVDFKNHQYIIALFFYSPVTYIFPEKDFPFIITS